MTTHKAQADIDALTTAAFAAAGLRACACGRMTDGVAPTCWPCQSGNTRGGFYGPAVSDGALATAVAVGQEAITIGRELNARIAELEYSVDYWRGRARGRGAE